MGREKRNSHNPLLEAIRRIYEYKDLLFVLATRDIKVRYKQTFLGVAWAILPALATMVIFTFINKFKILNISTQSVPYPIFAYCGLLPWTFFASSLTAATQSLVSYSGLINKIYFPKEIIPLSVILSKLIDLSISSIILVVMMLFYRIEFHLTIIAVPLLLVMQVFLIAGFSFFLSIFHLFYRDVGYVVGGIVPLLMFVTPVVYPIRIGSPQLQNILMFLNPMAPIINAYRDLILVGVWPDASTFALPLCLCSSLFVLGLLWFHKIEHLFAENI